MKFRKKFDTRFFSETQCILVQLVVVEVFVIDSVRSKQRTRHLSSQNGI